jgi:RHS repeat-associated protein
VLHVYYIHTDHLDAPKEITDTGGNVVWRNLPTTEPFGNSPPEENPGGLGTFKFNLRHSNYYADTETGTFYAHFRDCYDPATGRFCQSDPIGLAGGSFSTYTYTNQNPLSYVDPLGLYESSPWLRALIPGQVAFDNAVTALQAGNYGWTVAHGAAMLGEMAMSVTGFGTAQIAETAGQCVANGTLSSAGGVIRQFEQTGDKVYYRVFSGDADIGNWLTAVPPRSSAWAQEALSLPPGNKATMIQEVLVPNGTLLERSRAISMREWGRMHGGAEQFKVIDPIPRQNYGPGRPLP